MAAAILEGTDESLRIAAQRTKAPKLGGVRFSVSDDRGDEPKRELILVRCRVPWLLKRRSKRPVH